MQALARLALPFLPLGSSKSTRVGDAVVIGSVGGAADSVAARIVAKQEFAGYWEYVLDEAIFAAPSHPNWGGTALIGMAGELLGIGSLQIQRATGERRLEDVNMIVPIDLLKPILDDLLKFGKPNRPARPWLGFYATESEGTIAVLGVASRGPAHAAKLQAGDIVVEVAGRRVMSLADFLRKVWSLGSAGVEVPLTISRDGHPRKVTLQSRDRRQLLKGPVLH